MDHLADGEDGIVGFSHGVVNEDGHQLPDLVQISSPAFLGDRARRTMMQILGCFHTRETTRQSYAGRPSLCCGHLFLFCYFKNANDHQPSFIFAFVTFKPKLK